MGYKLFAHRGFVANNPNLKENTVKAFQNAVENHFEAIEVDICYYQKELILNHDKPSDNINNYDKLEDLFKTFGNRLEYWLDLKRLNPNNIKSVIKELRIVVDKAGINYDQIIFVPYLESLNLKDNLFAYDEIRNNFGEDCRIGALIETIKKEDFNKYYKSLVANNIYNASVNFKNINEDFVKIFSNINLFAWTVNNQKDLDYLIKLNVKNCVTDKITPHKNANPKTPLLRT